METFFVTKVSILIFYRLSKEERMMRRRSGRARVTDLTIAVCCPNTSKIGIRSWVIANFGNQKADFV